MRVRLSEGQIKNKAYYDLTFTKGERLFADDLVQDLTFEVHPLQPLMYQARAAIQGSAEQPYQIRIGFNKTGDLAAHTCTCPAYNENKGYCRHIIATLLEINELQSFGKEIVWEDAQHRYYTQYTEELLADYEAMITATLPAIPISKPVVLIPKLTYTSEGMVCEFAIGQTRKYVVKDLEAFVQAVSTGAWVSYGKELAFEHTAAHFSELSQQLLEWLMPLVTEQQLYTRHQYGQVHEKRSLLLSSTQLHRLLAFFSDEPIDVKMPRSKTYTPHHVSQHTPDFAFEVMQTNQGLEVHTALSPLFLLGEGQQWCLVTEEQLVVLDAETVQNLVPLLRKLVVEGNQLKIPKNLVPHFLALIFPRIQAHVTAESVALIRENYHLQPLASTIFLDVNQTHAIVANVELAYGEHVFTSFQLDQDVPTIRDRAKELLLQAVLEQSGFIARGDQFILTEEDRIYEFLASGVPTLLVDHDVQVSEQFQALHRQTPPKVSVGVRLESELMTFKFENLQFDPQEYAAILAKYQLKKKYHRLKDGSFLALDSAYVQSIVEVMESLALEPEVLQAEEIALSKYKAIYLERLLLKNNVQTKQNRAFQKLINDFEQLEQVEFELPTRVQATLRPYQAVGYRWLKTLAEYQMGGVLADDMGLGKTVQMITLLCDEYDQGQVKPSLIVTPSSLVYNWKAELAKFAPHLQVGIVSGNAQERERSIQVAMHMDVIITSYDSLKRDITLYQQQAFRYAILDEAHYIKNHTTLVAKSVKQIPSEIRFALTGTPLENSLADVWSIFDFILPGYLGSYPQFKKQYEQPIVKNDETNLLQRLHQLVEPFILRRLKKDVLTELPDKIESIVYCELEDEQQKLYDATLLQAHTQLREAVQTGEDARMRMKMLAMLTRLRQICCHPALYVEAYTQASAKLNLCLELVQESVESGHQVLIFSQFTSMFPLIGEQLEQAGIPYFTLTGETKSQTRLDLANRFNQGEVSVFLISLKAGGTGLNLTGADVVIHYDPWWNMSAQNQATDRAHRMGQTNKVQVYKLIAKDTIEEKIEQLQQRKLTLSDSLVKDGETFITNLTSADIENLFNN